jgi:RHS repeat-associated protein
MNARYYKPGSVSKFFSQDPVFWNLPLDYLLDPQQQNSYVYARNNPLNITDPTGLYNTKTGQVEEGDTQDGIVNTINSAFGIKTDWQTVYNVSFYKDNFGNKSLSDIVGQSLGIGTDVTVDITSQLNKLNYDRSKTAFWLGPVTLNNFAPGNRWDIKNGNDPVLGGGVDDRQYWSYIYNGELIRYDAPGNINFGYVARSLGLPTSVIIQGAQAQQAGDNVLHGKGFSWKDNSGDTAYIKQGIDQYKTTGPKWIRFFNSW